MNSEKAEDGKSFTNPLAEKKSEAYTKFTSPITNGMRGGFEYVWSQLSPMLVLAENRTVFTSTFCRRTPKKRSLLTSCGSAYDGNVSRTKFE
jgi:hypothetical protein